MLNYQRHEARSNKQTGFFFFLTRKIHWKGLCSRPASLPVFTCSNPTGSSEGIHVPSHNITTFSVQNKPKKTFKKCPPSRGVEDYTFSIRIYIPFPFFNSNVNLTDHLLCLRFIFIEIFIKYFESAGPLAPFKNDPPTKTIEK